MWWSMLKITLRTLIFDTAISNIFDSIKANFRKADSRMMDLGNFHIGDRHPVIIIRDKHFSQTLEYYDCRITDVFHYGEWRIGFEYEKSFHDGKIFEGALSTLLYNPMINTQRVRFADIDEVYIP